MKVGVGDLHEMPQSKYSCYENACIKSHILLLGVNENFAHILYIFSQT